MNVVDLFVLTCCSKFLEHQREKIQAFIECGYIKSMSVLWRGMRTNMRSILREKDVEGLCKLDNVQLPLKVMKKRWELLLNLKKSWECMTFLMFEWSIYFKYHDQTVFFHSILDGKMSECWDCVEKLAAVVGNEKFLCSDLGPARGLGLYFPQISWSPSVIRVLKQFKHDHLIDMIN
jgi:hypothetical protein